MLDRVREPGRIGTLALPHRIVMGSMHLSIEDRDDGGRAMAAFYAARARGGAGLIVTGGSAISRVGAAGRHYGFVNDPAHHERLALVVSRVHEAGARIALQLFHAGRYALREAFGLTPVAPSAVPSRFSPEPPAALDADGIASTIADFASGAAAARELGFDAVELMGSEGYLLNQFVSPLTNTRDDAWGGDPLRRQAFPLAVLDAVREAAGPGFPVIYRMSGADLMPGSTTDAETVEFALALAAHGVDALNVGVGWHESAVPTVQCLVPGGTWVPEAARIKRAVGTLPVITGNRINRLTQAEQILASGVADFVSMSRPFLADPELIASTLTGRTVNICIGCDQACIDNSLVDKPVSCLVNPAAGHESEPVPPRAGPEPTHRESRTSPDAPGRGIRHATPKNVAVVGAGPAGLAAARELAMLGHRVTILEAEPELGGQFRMARLVPGKADYGETITFYADELRRLGVTVRTGVHLEADRDGRLDSALDGADGVVLATGVRPRTVEIDGRDLPHVLDYPAAFAAASTPAGLGAMADGGVAIIGGGGIAVDLAHLITARGAAPAVARFRAEHGLAPDTPGSEDSWPLVGDGAVNADTTDTAVTAADSAAVTVMRRSGRIGAGMGRTTRWAVLADLRRHGARLLTGVAYRRIATDGVWITGQDGEELVAGGTVVIAAGGVPEASLAPALASAGLPFRTAGGARSTDTLDAVRAFAEGVSAARELSAELGSRVRA